MRLPLQTKRVEVGPANDRHEQEADRVASRVTSGLTLGEGSISPLPGRSVPAPAQRQEEPEGNNRAEAEEQEGEAAQRQEEGGEEVPEETASEPETGEEEEEAQRQPEEEEEEEAEPAQTAAEEGEEAEEETPEAEEAPAQRQEEEGEEEEEVQTAAEEAAEQGEEEEEESAQAQRQAEEEESEPEEEVGEAAQTAPVQRRVEESPDRARQARLSAAATEAVARKGPGVPLPRTVRRVLEPRFGYDFSQVRIHTGPEARRASSAVRAKAFTHRNHIWFGRGQSPSDLRLLSHELTHVVQQGHAKPRKTAGLGSPGRLARSEPLRPPSRVSSPGGRRLRQVEGASAPAALHPGTSRPSVQRFSLWGFAKRVGGAVVSGARAVARFAGDVVENAMELGRDALLAVVRRIAPDFAKLIERDGIIGFAKDLIKRGFQSLFGGVLDAVRGVVNFSGIAEGFRGIIGTLGEIFSGLAGNDCSALTRAARGVMNFFDETFGPAIDKIRGVAGKVSQFLSGIWDAIGVPIVDFLKRVGGTVWEGIKRFVSKVAGMFRAIKRAIGAAWQKIKDWFGIGAEEGEDEGGGLWEWIKGKASAAWEAIKATAQPIMGPLRVVGAVLVALSPAGPVLAVIHLWPRLKAAFSWIQQKWADLNIVVRARNYLANVLLPQLKSALASVGSGLQSAAQWLAGIVQRIQNGLEGAMGALGGSAILAPLRGLLGFLSRSFRTLGQVVSRTVGGALRFGKRVLDKAIEFIDPIWEVLKRIIAVAVNPFGIPGLLLGTLWKLIPNCLKGPLINFIIRVLLRFVRLIPPLLPALGLLWPMIREGLTGFLRRMLQFSVEEKVAASNKMANIISGGSVGFAFGYLRGLAEGLWQGVSGPFLAIRDLFQLPGLIRDFARAMSERFSDLVREARELISAAVDRAGDTVDSLIEQARDLLENPRKIIDILRSALEAAIQAARDLGAWVAGKMMQIFQQPDEQIGNQLGNLTGFALVTGVTSFFTAGAAGAASVISRIVGLIGRVARNLMTIIRQVLPLIQKVLGFVRRIAGTFQRAGSAAGGFLGRILQFFQRVIATFRRALGAAGRGARAAAGRAVGAARRGAAAVRGVAARGAARVRSAISRIGSRIRSGPLGRAWRRFRRDRARQNARWRRFVIALRSALLPYRETGMTRVRLRSVVNSVRARHARVAGSMLITKSIADYVVRVFRRLSVRFVSVRVLMDAATRLRAGRKAVQRRLRRLRDSEVNKGGLDAAMSPIRTLYRFKSLAATGAGGAAGWRIIGSMSPAVPLGHVDDTKDLHEGTDADPIPLHWYKDPGNYPQNITLRSSGAPQRVPMTVPTTLIVNGEARTVGILGSNLVRPGHRLRRGSVFARSGSEQRRFRNTLRDAGFNWVGRDADHVKDLGFGGTDSFGNLWPLNAGVNRRGFTWYWRYLIEYKKSPGVKRRRPLMFLGNKVFEVIGFRYPPPRPGGRR